MTDIIITSDLPVSLQSAELIDTMVAGVNAKASRVAPCLTWDGTVTDEPAPTVGQLAEARLILVGAVRRWVESGAGALQAQTAGPFGMTVDTRQRTGFNLWPSEITGLQEVCASQASSAFTIDTVSTSVVHADICAVNFGALYCSCGASLTLTYPLWEV